MFEALLKEPNVRKGALERSFETCRPDISAHINNVPVAIKAQISSPSIETIIRLIKEFASAGKHVLHLKDKNIKSLQTDHGGRLFQSLDIQDVENTIPVLRCFRWNQN